MEWLHNLIDYSGQWAPLKIAIPAFMVIAGLWIWVDANGRTGNGCVWGAIAFACPPVGIPLYYISLAYLHTRGPGAAARQRSQERATREDERKRIVMMGDLEKQRERTVADGQTGTMFDTAAGMGKRSGGYQHFTDHRAEDLLQSGRYAQAWEYLRDLHRIAVQDDDQRGRETYRAYIARLPDAAQRLREL